MLELRKLGCALWLIGDPSSRLLNTGDNWHSADLTGDISETVMLRTAVDCRRCVFTEPKRCDARLFSWLSSRLYQKPLRWPSKRFRGAVSRSRRTCASDTSRAAAS